MTLTTSPTPSPIPTPPASRAVRNVRADCGSGHERTDHEPAELEPAEHESADREHADVDTLDSHAPLVSRVHLDRRVRQLVPCAVQRQLWLILLDADRVQMPVMIPIGDLPLRARAADGEGLRELLAGLDREFGVGSFVFIMERPGPSFLDKTDLRWLRFLLRSCDELPVDVRGVYLCHDEGPIGFETGDLPQLEAGALPEAGEG